MPKPTQTELILAGFSVACVLVRAMGSLGWMALDGALPIGLYPLYTTAAVSGWILGNLWVRRARTLTRIWWLALLPFYLLLPVGPLFLLRALAPLPEQVAAPLVPWLSMGIVVVFFLVPVTLRPRVPARSPRIGARRPADEDCGEPGRPSRESVDSSETPAGD